jgi:MFS superfamily sulfate permease-like transporter
MTAPAAFSLRRPSLFDSLRGYQPTFLGADIVAGLTLAAIAIPEQMATARLGALPPQLGFIAFVAASLAFLVFGVSRQLSAGADSTITPIFAGALALLAASGSPHYAALAAGLAVMVGILVAAAGVLRMGWIGNLLSTPVTLGFLVGIAVHIAVSQAPAALGLAPLFGPTLGRIGRLIALAPHADLATLALAVAVLAVIVACHRISPRLPGPLVGVVGAAVAVPLLGLHGVTLLGPVAGGPPQLGAPALSVRDILHLAPLALIVALVVMVQTAATARSFPPPGGLPDEDGDFFGIGLANLAAGLAGAFPVNASPPRTAIVAESGGRSQIASAAAVVVVLTLLLFGARLLAVIPEAALAAILLFVAGRIVRLAEIARVIRAAPMEALLILATAIALIVLPIAQGVAFGISLSLLNGLWAGARQRLVPMSQIPGTSVWWPVTPETPASPIADVAVRAFQAPLNFLNAENFERDMLVAIDGGAKLVVLEAAGVIDIDYTAAESLKVVVRAANAAGVAFALARLESTSAQAALDRFGLRAVIGADHVFESVAHAIAVLAPNAGAAAPASE